MRKKGKQCRLPSEEYYEMNVNGQNIWKTWEKDYSPVTPIALFSHFIIIFLHDLLLLEVYSDGNFFLQALRSPHSIIHSSQGFKLQRKTGM